MNIFVGNLPHSLTEEELTTLFEQYGPVASVKIIKDKFTGSPRGFGFVNMTTHNDADTAIEGLNGTEVGGRRIRVNKAHKQQDRRPPRRF